MSCRSLARPYIVALTLIRKLRKENHGYINYWCFLGHRRRICTSLRCPKQDLVLVARSQDKLNKLAEEFKSQHSIRVTVFALDLSEPDAAERLWEETNRAGLEIDVLVNNAGFGTSGDVADESPERLEQEVRLNCLTLTGLTARYLPAMRERKTEPSSTLLRLLPFSRCPIWRCTAQPKHSCFPLLKRSGPKPEKTASAYLRSVPAPPIPHSLKSPVNLQQSENALCPSAARQHVAYSKNHETQFCGWSGERHCGAICNPRGA